MLRMKKMFSRGIALLIAFAMVFSLKTIKQEMRAQEKRTKEEKK